MPRINHYELDLEDFDAPSVEPIRRNTDHVNAHHDLLRRTENAINRHRKQARDLKERNR